jgi:hypothetical protein
MTNWLSAPTEIVAFELKCRTCDLIGDIAIRFPLGAFDRLPREIRVIALIALAEQSASELLSDENQEACPAGGRHSQYLILAAPEV